MSIGVHTGSPSGRIKQALYVEVLGCGVHHHRITRMNGCVISYEPGWENNNRRSARVNSTLHRVHQEKSQSLRQIRKTIPPLNLVWQSVGFKKVSHYYCSPTHPHTHIHTILFILSQPWRQTLVC